MVDGGDTFYNVSMYKLLFKTKFNGYLFIYLFIYLLDFCICFVFLFLFVCLFSFGGTLGRKENCHISLKTITIITSL